MKIRLATANDAKDIARVERNRGWPNGIRFDPFERTIKLFKERGAYVFVAEKNKRIVGYRAFIKSGKNANPGYLSIEKKFQDEGIGSALLAYSIKYASKIGCKKMTIYVNNNNFRAINIYNKMEFNVVQIIKRKGKLKLRMEKAL